jgi:hypothetical protein
VIRRVGLLVALAVLAAAGCGGRTPAHPSGTGPGTGTPSGPGRPTVRTAGCATHTGPPSYISLPGASEPANEQRLGDLADRIVGLAQERYPDAYAGVQMLAEQDRLRVYRRPSKDLDAWILRDFRAECVELVDAAHSAAELQALVDRITNDLDYWEQNGIRVNEVSARFDGSAVEVGTVDVDKARAELPKRYGTAIAIVVINQERPSPAGPGP